MKIIITGGTGAIGAALVREFATDFEVVFTYHKSREKAQALGQELSVSYYKCDVRNYEEITEFFKAEKGCDVLINNAGISQIKLFTDITSDEWNDMLAVNLTSAFNMTKQALPYMIAKKSGVIINISSVWGLSGASCEVHYSASKAGLIGFTKSLAKEAGPSGIRVNCIAPGVIESPMNEVLGNETLVELKNETPLGKLGSPEDIAHAARYLVEAGFVTGQVLTVDGGFNVT